MKRDSAPHFNLTDPEELGILLVQFGCAQQSYQRVSPCSEPCLYSAGTQELTYRHFVMTEVLGLIQDMCKCLRGLMENL